MSLKKLRAKQKKDGAMKRKDLSDNLVHHVNTEIAAFCVEEKMSIHEGLQCYSPTPDDPKRPVDATRDLAAHHNLRTKSVGNIPSDQFEDFIRPGEGMNRPSAIIGISHLNKTVDNILINSIPPLGEDGKAIDSSLSRSDLDRAMNPETIMMLEVQRQVMTRLRIANVVAGRLPIRGDSGLVPILVTVPKVENQGTANRRVPRYAIETDSEPLKLTEDGFEVEIDDATRRTSATTMEAVNESVRQRTEFFEQDIVNAICQSILSNITGELNIPWSATPNAKDLMKLHLILDDVYMFTTFVGTLDGLVEYLAIDPSYASDTQRPATPNMRQTLLLDQMLGRETVAKRRAANVPALGADTDKKFGCWDRRNTFQFYTERGGSLNDSYREEADRLTVLRFVMNYGGRLRADANNCRAFVTMS